MYKEIVLFIGILFLTLGAVNAADNVTDDVVDIADSAQNDIIDVDDENILDSSPDEVLGDSGTYYDL